MLFPLEKTRVKSGTVLIETVLSGDYLYFENVARQASTGQENKTV